MAYLFKVQIKVAIFPVGTLHVYHASIYLEILANEVTNNKRFV